MTYKLGNDVKKIIALVIAVVENDKQEYANGTVLSKAKFSRPYIIRSINASDNKIILNLIEIEKINDSNWVDEEQAGCF